MNIPAVEKTAGSVVEMWHSMSLAWRIRSKSGAPVAVCAGKHQSETVVISYGLMTRPSANSCNSIMQ